MPALPSQQPVAVAVRHRTSSKDHYPYSSAVSGISGMGSISNIKGASATTTSNRNPNNSMYMQMSLALEKEQHLLQEESKIEESSITKSKKSPPRPSTPGASRQKNFIEKNKQSIASSPPKPSILVKRSKEDSLSISPPATLKLKQNRPVTPNAQSSARPKVDKKKNDGVPSSTKSRRPTSPASPTQSAHSRSHSHVRVTSPEAGSQSGHGNSAHSRSHVRAASPEITALRDEVKKLKKLLSERDEWLHEKEAELLEAEDIVEALQERVREVEARNRELQNENSVMRNYIEDDIEKKKSSSKEPTKIIDSMKTNIQRIRGGSASPVSKPNSPTMPDSPRSSSPMDSPKVSPVLNTSKSKELLKANTKVQNDSLSPSLRPRIVTPQTRGNLIPANNQKNLVSNNNDHPPRPTAPSPAAMNRHEPKNNENGGFTRTEMLNKRMEMTRDRHASALDRKQAAALNAVMEESEDSEVDEFVFERDDDETSDDQADSEFDATTESENDDYDSVNPSGVNTENDEDDDDESVNGFDKWSTHASSKIELDSIVEEDDDEDDEFDFEPQQIKTLQEQKNRTSNPSSSVKANVARDASMTNVSGNHNKGQSPCYPHRDSMSSNSSDDSSFSVSSSQSDSYPSSVTSPSESNFGFTDSAKSNLAKNSNKSNSTSVSRSSSLNNNDSNDSIPVTRTPSPTKTHDMTNSKRSSPNLVSKQFNPRSTSPTTASIRATSPASSSRASTPSSNASTARAPSPASHSSSRASTPASESSRNASGYNRKPRQNSSSDNCSTAIPPPPPPPANKDPFATLQHYLRLISENSVMENPQKCYDVKKVIDEGSSAKVFTAHPLANPDEECAIKVIPLSYSLEFIFNEIYVLKNLKHKNIVDFKESFLRWDGKTREVWIAMEKCARGDVTSRAGKINQREVGRIAGALLSALKHLHANGIIHRDIKLSNILADANNEIKLADFGISSLTPTSTTAMVGTIPYMAPDVVLVGADRPYDTKVDIWSVGVCILELLTGKAAWGRIRDDEIMDKLRRGEAPYGFQRLRKKADISWEAIDFLEKCFIKTPENRWDAEKLLEHPFITGNHN